MSSRRADIRAGPEVVQVDAGRDQCRIEADLAQPIAVPRGDRHVVELVPVGGQDGDGA